MDDSGGGLSEAEAGLSRTGSGGLSGGETGGLSDAETAVSGIAGETAAGSATGSSGFQSDASYPDITQTEVANEESQGSDVESGGAVSDIGTVRSKTGSAVSAKSGTTAVNYFKRSSPALSNAVGDVSERWENSNSVLTPAKPEDIPTSRTNAKFSGLKENETREFEIPKLKLANEADENKHESLSSLDILLQEHTVLFGNTISKNKEERNTPVTILKPTTVSGVELVSQ